MTLEISPQARDALEGWLAASRALRGNAEATLTAYRTDVVGFITFMTGHFAEPQGLAPLSRIETRDMRSWMAAVRADGAGARTMARKLSAVKAFYRWLAASEGVEPGWNFHKVLIGPDGAVAGNWGSTTEPLSAAITGPIEAILRPARG